MYNYFKFIQLISVQLSRVKATNKIIQLTKTFMKCYALYMPGKNLMNLLRYHTYFYADIVESDLIKS